MKVDAKLVHFFQKNKFYLLKIEKTCFLLRLGLEGLSAGKENGGLILHFVIMFDKRAEYYERAMVSNDHGKANVQPGIKNIKGTLYAYAYM
ncbi:MAG: hypothetical protein IJQ18_08850 [Paludibacteraceae bacterium]|nr:hypothetical protein [Paludibacteraceae bacterium]